MKRSRVKPRRDTPRRREAPRWTPEEWQAATTALHRRSGLRCECCGTPLANAAERHHRQRRAVGGDRLANLLLLAPTCHAHWTTHPDEAMRRGIIVSSYTHDPGMVPVLHAGTRWVVLDDTGDVFTAPGPTAG